MKKLLIVATVVKKHIMVFHIPYLEWFKKNGYDVHVAAGNDYDNKEDCNIPFCDKFYELPFSRSPLSKENIHAYRELKRIVKENDYDLIHCHTPVGGAIGRLASRKSGATVFYTAHGFHFHKGAPFKNWLIYYFIEKWLSRYTDCLITMNEEDYNIAKTKRFKAKKIVKIHGVGVNLDNFEPQSKERKTSIRKEYGYREDEFILFYAAELNSNKHQDLLINIVKILKDRIPNVKLILAGSGPLENDYKEQVRELDLVSNVEFLGFRSDVKNLLMLSDVAVASSRREGLPVNVMEAMATGLPLVVTDVRGHRDLVKDGKNGYVIEQDNIEKFSKAIERLYKDRELRNKFGKRSIELVQGFSIENVMEEMKEIYRL